MTSVNFDKKEGEIVQLPLTFNEFELVNWALCAIVAAQERNLELTEFAARHIGKLMSMPQYVAALDTVNQKMDKLAEKAFPDVQRYGRSDIDPLQLIHKLLGGCKTTGHCGCESSKCCLCGEEK